MNYNPDYRNTHTIRITLNSNGYIGHIATKVGGNTKGADVLEYALNFIEDCDDNDIENLVENDCNFELCSDEDEEEFWFSMTLINSDGDKLIFSDAEERDVKDIIVSVEIIDCIPE